jgi:hypothetical protein
MLESDIECWKVPRFVKTEKEVRLDFKLTLFLQVKECIEILHKHFSDIKKLFTCCSCTSTYPTISMLDFANMC